MQDKMKCLSNDVPNALWYIYPHKVALSLSDIAMIYPYFVALLEARVVFAKCFLGNKSSTHHYNNQMTNVNVKCHTNAYV